MHRKTIAIIVLLVSLFGVTILQAQTEQFGHITGYVLEKTTLEPIAGTAVQILGTRHTAVTDFDGIFLLGGLRPGEYDLKFMAFGFSTKLVERVIVLADSTTVIKQYLIKDTTRSDNVITVTGRQNIIDIFGPRGPIVISQEKLKVRPVTPIDELLEIAASPVPSGSQIFIRDGGMNDYFIVDIADSVSIDVEPIDTNKTDSLTLQGQLIDGWISGTLLDEETSEPIIGAYIFTSNMKHSSVSDHNGDFILTNIVPGVQDITISSPQYAMLRIEHIEVIADSTTIVSKRLLKNATPPDTILVEFYEQREIRPKQIGHIKGLLLQEGSKEPIARARVYIEGTRFRAISDFDGNFLISELPSGEYTLTISSIGYEFVKIEHVKVGPDSTTEIRQLLKRAIRKVQNFYIE